MKAMYQNTEQALAEAELRLAEVAEAQAERARASRARSLAQTAKALRMEYGRVFEDQIREESFAPVARPVPEGEAED